MEDDLLYDHVDPFFPVQSENKDSRPTRSIQEIETVNKALKKNISCLYKTARLELERRDREIARLQLRVGELEYLLTNEKMTSENTLQPHLESFPVPNGATLRRNHDTPNSNGRRSRSPHRSKDECRQTRTYTSRSKSHDYRSHSVRHHSTASSTSMYTTTESNKRETNRRKVLSSKWIE